MPPSQGQDGGQLASSGERQRLSGIRPLGPEHPVLCVWTPAVCPASWTWLTPLSPYFLLCEVRTTLHPLPPGAGAEETPGRHHGPLFPPSLLPQIPKDKKILVM